MGHVSPTLRIVFGKLYQLLLSSIMKKKKVSFLVPLDKSDCYNTEILDMFFSNYPFPPSFPQLSTGALFLRRVYITCVCS